VSDSVIDLVSSSIIQNHNELDSNTMVNFINTLDIKYIIQCMENQYDMNSTVAVSTFLDWVSSAIIRNTKSLDLESVVQSHYFKDLVSTAFRPYSSDIESNTSVTDLTVLDMVFNLIQSPILTLKCSTVQDAYLRQARSTVNYGSYQSLIVGSLVEGDYAFLIQLNIDSFLQLQNDIVINSSLVFTTSGTVDSLVIIDVYEQTSIWSEGVVTWASYTPDLSKLIGSFNCTGSSVRVDLTSYLNTLRSNGNSNVNLYFKVRSDPNIQIIYFDSKDTIDEINRPHIEIQYQDSNWVGYLGLTDLASYSNIRTKNARDIYSATTVRNKGMFDLDSNYIIRRKLDTDIDSSLRVKQIGHNELDSTSSVIPGVPLISTTVIRRSLDNDNPGIANIYKSNDLDSVAVTTTSFSFLIGLANIRTNGNFDLSSMSYIWKSLGLSSNSIIRNADKIDISSYGINKQKSNSQLDSNTRINQVSDIVSNALLGIIKTLDLTSISQLRRQSYNYLDISSSLNIVYNSSLNSSSTIRNSKNTDMSSIIMIGYLYWLSSSATISRPAVPLDYDLDSSSKIQVHSKLELNSLSNIFNSNDLYSSVIQRINSNSDLTSSARLRVTSALELSSISTILQKLDLSSTVIQRLTNKSDILSNSLIRQIKDLISTASMFNKMDLSSTSVTRHTQTIEISSNSIVRQSDIDEINSSVFLKSIQKVDITATAIIRSRSLDYLLGISTIQTTARQWIPNKYGDPIFDYGDRKLPRLWKRENFIT